MLSDYQDRLDYLYARLNYEWLGMPRIPAELKLGRMRACSAGWVIRIPGCRSSTSRAPRARARRPR